MKTYSILLLALLLSWNATASQEIPFFCTNDNEILDELDLQDIIQIGTQEKKEKKFKRKKKEKKPVSTINWNANTNTIDIDAISEETTFVGIEIPDDLSTDHLTDIVIYTDSHIVEGIIYFTLNLEKIMEDYEHEYMQSAAIFSEAGVNSPSNSFPFAFVQYLRTHYKIEELLITIQKEINRLCFHKPEQRENLIRLLRSESLFDENEMSVAKIQILTEIARFLNIDGEDCLKASQAISSLKQLKKLLKTLEAIKTQQEQELCQRIRVSIEHLHHILEIDWIKAPALGLTIKDCLDGNQEHGLNLEKIKRRQSLMRIKEETEAQDFSTYIFLIRKFKKRSGAAQS